MAVRTHSRPMPEPSFSGRVARAFAYVLLVVTCTVIAALGGYQVGVRSNPSESTSAAQRTTAVHDAVARAVSAQKAKDRAKRRSALRQLAAFQRDRFDSELSSKISEVRIAEAANAARAYRRGKVAGRASAPAVKVGSETPDEPEATAEKADTAR
ncbi:MAG: hypothetical protein ACJ762_06955 [Solirubrobacteraceae bacterium]